MHLQDISLRQLHLRLGHESDVSLVEEGCSRSLRVIVFGTFVLFDQLLSHVIDLFFLSLLPLHEVVLNLLLCGGYFQATLFQFLVFSREFFRLFRFLLLNVLLFQVLSVFAPQLLSLVDNGEES